MLVVIDTLTKINIDREKIACSILLMNFLDVPNLTDLQHVLVQNDPILASHLNMREKINLHYVHVYGADCWDFDQSPPCAFCRLIQYKMAHLPPFH